MGNPQAGVILIDEPIFTIIPPSPELVLAIYCIPKRVPITEPRIFVSSWFSQLVSSKTPALFTMMSIPWKIKDIDKYQSEDNF